MNMSTIKSKKTFLCALATRLSLCHSFDDTKNIVADYEEWFENETAAGKTEAEILSSLNISDIVNKNSDSGCRLRLGAILQNPFPVSVSFLTVLFVFELCTLHLCSRNGYEFALIAAVSNLLLFLAKTAASKTVFNKSGIDPDFWPNEKLLLFPKAYFVFLLAAPGPACALALRFDLLTGPFFNAVLISGTAALFLFNLSLCRLLVFNMKQIFPIIVFVHGLGVWSLYYANELHRLYLDNSDSMTFLSWTLILILEILLISVPPHVLQRFRRKRKNAKEE